MNKTSGLHCSNVRAHAIVGRTAQRLLHSLLTLLLCSGLAQAPPKAQEHRIVHTALALRIAQAEGFYLQGSLPARLHNPGALVFARQHDAVRGALGFARFPSDSSGWLALERDLQRKRAAHIPLQRGWEYLQ